MQGRYATISTAERDHGKATLTTVCLTESSWSMTLVCLTVGEINFHTAQDKEKRTKKNRDYLGKKLWFKTSKVMVPFMWELGKF